MKKLLTVLMILLTSGCIFTKVNPQKAEYIARQQVTNPMVVPIDNDRQGKGCGFFYRGYLITAAHMNIKDALITDKERDIAILNRTTTKSLARSLDIPLFGEIVTGFMRLTWMKEDTGVIIKIPALFVGKDLTEEKTPEIERYLISINTLRGFSGSPILDMQNRLLGIGTGYFPTFSSHPFIGYSPASLLVSFVGVNEIDKVIDRYEKG